MKKRFSLFGPQEDASNLVHHLERWDDLPEGCGDI
jgi:hypothetical protein